MTMADLARDRTPEQAGWNALQEQRQGGPPGAGQRLLDAAEGLLSAELLPLFSRSIEPTLLR